MERVNGVAELTEAQARKRDEIAESLKADPKFEPLPGRTKEESAFAVATDTARKSENPGHDNPMDETLKMAIMQEAESLRVSGEPDLEAKGLILQVATSRGDTKAVRKILGDLVKMAKEEGIEYAAETYGYLRESLPEEAPSG